MLLRVIFLLMPGVLIYPMCIGQSVHIIGAMKNVMWNGQLEGSINLDTIANRAHLYGIGPVEYLSGEILVLDGRSYVSSVISDSEMKVEETFEIKAPFLGYSNIERWTETSVPDGVFSIGDLEIYIDSLTEKQTRPFFFRLKGTIDSATIHIVNLPPGSKVSSPDEAHEGLTKYYLKDEEVEILGFFSTAHQAILTHHDTFMHLHLITADRRKMGHLDALSITPLKMKLYLPDN